MGWLEVQGLLTEMTSGSCKKCKGEKTVKEKKRLEIFIEKGMADKEKIVLHGEGDQEVRARRAPSFSTFHRRLLIDVVILVAGRRTWGSGVRSPTRGASQLRT